MLGSRQRSEPVGAACSPSATSPAEPTLRPVRVPGVLPRRTVHRTLLALNLHLPPSAVLLVSDFRFRRSAQRSARLTL
jgi:hypothetical protein